MASHESGGRLNETVERIADSVLEMQRLERKINSETAPEDLTDDLACLGEVTFGEVEFGPE